MVFIEVVPRPRINCFGVPQVHELLHSFAIYLAAKRLRYAVILSSK